MAPELMIHIKSNEKVDVYSFALVLLELLVNDGSFVKKGFKGLSMLNVVTQDYRPPIPVICLLHHPEVVKLIKMCWNGKFNKRPSAVEVCDLLDESSTFQATNDEVGKCTDLIKGSG